MGVFAERLKEAMTTRKMTQLQLAATVGLGKSSISQYLSGRNIPNTLNLKQIANALDVSVDWLNGKDEEMNPIRNLRVADAAKLMGVGCQCIRQGLKMVIYHSGVRLRCHKADTVTTLARNASRNSQELKFKKGN